MADAAWCCRHPLPDVLLAWEGEQHVVYFDPVSGDTHLIAALGAQLAEWLADGPRSRAALLALMQTAIDWDQPPSPESMEELLDHHLHRLAEIHLLAEEPAA